MNETALIAKILGEPTWLEMSGPAHENPEAEVLAHQLLKISGSNYVEYCLAGATYRIVKRYQLPAYGIDPDPSTPF